MSELQAGMLALVIGACHRPENIGKIVKIVKEAGEIEISVFGHGFVVEGLGNADWALTKHLLPIKPEADPLDVTNKEELHA